MLARSSGAFSTPHIAVVGGGLGGLAVAYQASCRNCKVDVIDGSTVGIEGASRLASLMHPHSPRGKLIWQGLEGIALSLEQMGFAESYCEPNTSIFFCKGKAIRRPAFNQEHVAMFVAAASEYPEYISFDTKDEDYASGSATFQKSYVVNTPLYLSRLRHGLETKYNLKWVAKALTAAELRGLQSSYDFVVVCAGAEVKNLWPDKELPVTYVRGQNVIYQSSSTSSLGDARICGEYVVPIGGGRILGGATHEYSIDDLHKGPDMDTALSILTPSLNVLYPSLKNAVPVSCEAGVRVATQRTHLGKIPQIGIHPELDRTWMLTGLASHGLVHHALVAKLLVTALLSSDGFDSLPAEVRYTPDL